MSYDLRVKNGMASVCVDRSINIHWVSLGDAIRLVEKSDALPLKDRVAIIRVLIEMQCMDVKIGEQHEEPDTS